MKASFAMIDLCLWGSWWSMWLLAGLTAKQNLKREPISDRVWHWAPLACGYCLLFSPVAIVPTYQLGTVALWRWLYVSVIIDGFALAWWARIHLGDNWTGLVATKVNHVLIYSGPYRYVRHPIYSGLILATVATALSVNTAASMIGAALCVVAYLVKIRHEEKWLLATFGEQYQWLCAMVPARLVPFLF